MTNLSDDGDFARWGYADSRLAFDGARGVRMSGRRYALAGVALPSLIPFAEEALGLPLSADDLQTPIIPQAPPARQNPAFLTALRARFAADRIGDSDRERVRHGHGQLSVGEIYRINRGAPPARIPDLVFYPQTQDEAAALIELADRHGASLIPYGGGTNVSGALACPPDEDRFIVSADMRRMNAVVWIDENNMLARVQAGICGAELERQLARRGFTAGHEPDSMEFSTLGGWIATLASGMKKNRYGNIEDIVADATMLCPGGRIVGGVPATPAPRLSAGIAPRILALGSEGGLGLITDAVIKIHRRPQEQRYASAVFPSFARGFAFLRAMRADGGNPPASIRLVNNREFRMGQALRPAASSRLEKAVRAMQRFILIRALGFDPAEMCACTILMEGGETRRQERRLMRLAKRFGARPGGAANGRRGYALTFAIAYIRDFLNQLNIIGETFETAAPWSKALAICAAAERALAAECGKHGVAGRPYLAYRVTQTYHSGVCIYFTMGFHARGLADPIAVFDAIEKQLRQIVMDNGGAISHHHGVGKVRGAFLPRQHSAATLDAARGAKRALDPRNIFAAGNGAFAKDES